MCRIPKAVFLAASCVLLQGCFSMDVTVKLNPDGSGTVVEKTTLQKQFLEGIRQMAEGFSAGAPGNGKTRETLDMFSEEQARKRAASYGPGVELVSARKISDTAAEGMEAVYSFADIERLRLDQKPDNMVPGNLAHGPSRAPAGMPQRLRFERLPGGNARLTLTIPWDPKVAQQGRETPSPVQPEAGKPPVSQEQMAQAMQMFQGMRISLAIEPQGRLVRTSSPYVSGNRVTVFEMNMEELLTVAADPETLTRMMMSPPVDAAEARRLLGQFKGFKFCLDPEVTIEFSTH